MNHGKKWQEKAKSVERTKQYELEEGLELLKSLSYTKFDGSVDASIKISYKSLQNVRGILSLPHGTGKQIRVLVFCKEDKAEAAKAAGADFVGGIELVEKIQKENWTDFDACVATPDMMKDVGKLGPILGRKGLMPKPRAGTVTPDVGKAVTNLKSGQMEYRPDKTGVVHLVVGKMSFDSKSLTENVRALYSALIKDKPADAKGEFIKSLYLSPTMGPSVRLSLRGLA